MNIPRKRLKLLMDNHSNKYSYRKPKILINEMTDRIMKETTGFPSITAMICYVIILHKGDLNAIMDNTSTNTLTWFEEWMVCLERLWGRSIGRWCEASQKYGLLARHLSDVFDKKIRLILKTRKEMVFFVTYHEDKLLRQIKWETHFSTKRLKLGQYGCSVVLHAFGRRSATENL
jgi:hypothetical protein